jgi:outer membrane immunogenic protein
MRGIASSGAAMIRSISVLAIALVSAALLPAAKADSQWSGSYLGVYGGYVDAGSKWDAAAAAGETLSPEGGTLGVLFGVNWEQDGLLLGTEANIAFTDFGETDDCANPVFECTLEVNWLGSLRGRAGLALDNVLVYGTGGLAWSVIQTSTDEIGNPSETQALLGWTAGVGVDVALTEGVRIGVEYRHSEYGDADALSPSSAFRDFDLDTDEVTIRLSVPLN